MGDAARKGAASEAVAEDHAAGAVGFQKGEFGAYFCEAAGNVVGDCVVELVIAAVHVVKVRDCFVESRAAVVGKLPLECADCGSGFAGESGAFHAFVGDGVFDKEIGAPVFARRVEVKEAAVFCGDERERLPRDGNGCRAGLRSGLGCGAWSCGGRRGLVYGGRRCAVVCGCCGFSRGLRASSFSGCCVCGRFCHFGGGGPCCRAPVCDSSSRFRFGDQLGGDMFGDAPDVFYHRGGVLKHTPVNPLMGVPYLRTRLVPDRKVGAVNMSAAERLERD